MTLTDLPQVQALSSREKLQLAEEIWLSAVPELTSSGISKEERELLDKRWSAFLENPGAALTVEQFKSNLQTLGS